MRMPITNLEKTNLPRVIFSIQSKPPTSPQKILPLMKEAYAIGVWCFDLPGTNHLESFKELKDITLDEKLIGIVHVEAEEGASFLGKPLHRFEPKIISTIRKDLFSSHPHKNILPSSSSMEIFTQKEIDRITFDPLRFEKTLSPFDSKESPFLMLGGKYGDWLLALGRLDLLKKMVTSVREKGFIPVFSGMWPTFTLPKAKSLDVSAYAVPINKNRAFFDLHQAIELIKKFDKPVISLDPLDGLELLSRSKEAFSFLFDELKILAAMVQVDLEEEVREIMGVLEKFPSFTPLRKA